MLKLDMAIDRYNRVLRGAAQLRESVILNKVDEQTVSKVLRGYDAKIADYRKETIDLSKAAEGSNRSKGNYWICFCKIRDINKNNNY